MDRENLRKEILSKAREYAKGMKQEKFVPGKTAIHYAGRVFDSDEVASLVDSSLDFWLTSGRYSERFEREFAEFFGLAHCSLVNSGSSANLLALSCLTSDFLGGRKLSPGDRVVTCATGFPTTVNPIFQNGLVPVFVDAEVGTYNASAKMVEAAAEKGAKAVMIAHALGNPFDLDSISAAAKKHGMYLIEDCCDAVGASFGGRPVGSFGELATVSFYPAHHMTMGEGGAVLTSNPLLKKLVESFRDWGRDCWCPPGKSSTCGKRFGWKLGNLPEGYDHKYIYSNIGYNLKATDMQAAVGVEQIKKLPGFIAKRKENFAFFKKRLADYSRSFVLPESHPKAEPSPFGFPLSVRKGAGFTRNEVVQFLESKKIETRMLFGGNLVRQPAYLKRKFEVEGSLENSDFIMESTFWIGVYPGLTEEMREYVASCFDEFMKGR
ncbi:UDP-4-amino-4-deoxy-L-arabinose--oxoglutarate aminotransferase [uncultured archaeon]|nr:UDP-4-amino-4-deoxy-L-arabinose--oxoglutarate aminotransferase [uncultured archaeon]